MSSRNLNTQRGGREVERARRQQALVAWSAVPVVLLVTTSRPSPPHLKVRNCSSSSMTLSPSVSP
jgi:hypothetical protein